MSAGFYATTQQTRPWRSCFQNILYIHTIVRCKRPGTFWPGFPGSRRRRDVTHRRSTRRPTRPLHTRLADWIEYTCSGMEALAVKCFSEEPAACLSAREQRKSASPPSMDAYLNRHTLMQHTYICIPRGSVAQAGSLSLSRASTLPKSLRLLCSSR